ncbi:hypothetical protein K439DRAFT_1614530 [Ramaria rubella]|nr:hypothetical protein K439DRAFT_1614530 [Ramaria rubella]
MLEFPLTTPRARIASSESRRRAAQTAPNTCKSHPLAAATDFSPYTTAQPSNTDTTELASSKPLQHTSIRHRPRRLCLYADTAARATGGVNGHRHVPAAERVDFTSGRVVACRRHRILCGRMSTLALNPSTVATAGTTSAKGVREDSPFPEAASANRQRSRPLRGRRNVPEGRNSASITLKRGLACRRPKIPEQGNFSVSPEIRGSWRVDGCWVNFRAGSGVLRGCVNGRYAAVRAVPEPHQWQTSPFHLEGGASLPAARKSGKRWLQNARLGFWWTWGARNGCPRSPSAHCVGSAAKRTAPKSGDGVMGRRFALRAELKIEETLTEILGQVPGFGNGMPKENTGRPAGGTNIWKTLQNARGWDFRGLERQKRLPEIAERPCGEKGLGGYPARSSWDQQPSERLQNREMASWAAALPCVSGAEMGRGTYGISEDRTGRLYVLTVIAPVFKPKPTKPINGGGQVLHSPKSTSELKATAYTASDCCVLGPGACAAYRTSWSVVAVAGEASTGGSRSCDGRNRGSSSASATRQAPSSAKCSEPAKTGAFPRTHRFWVLPELRMYKHAKDASLTREGSRTREGDWIGASLPLLGRRVNQAVDPARGRTVVTAVQMRPGVS